MVRAVHKLFKLTYNKNIAALPKIYIDYLEEQKAPRERVVDPKPELPYLDYNQHKETGFVFRVPDHPIQVTFPPNSEKGLWAGLGYVEGFHKPKRLKPRHTRIWEPTIEKHTFYSEVLDVHINVEVTDRTLELIDKHQGFDLYILQTPVRDLVSELGRRLKHKMLLALATTQDEKLLAKYKDFIRPLDEAQWLGLKESEALVKFRQMRIEESIEPPLKVTYAKQLIKRLQTQSAS